MLHPLICRFCVRQAGQNCFSTFFGGFSEQLVHLQELQITVCPGDTVFHDNVFNMLILAAECLNDNGQGYILTKGDIQQQEVFDDVWAVGRC